MRRLLTLALLAGLALAGCVSPPAATLAPAVTVPADLDVFAPLAYDATGAMVALPTDIPLLTTLVHDVRGAEPTLGVTSNGYIFYVAMANVLRSADGGKTWEQVSTPVSSPTTLDPFIYVDPDTDRVYSDQLYLGCSYLSYSDDYGSTWITNPAACGVPVNDHQKLVSAKNRGPVPTTAYSKVLFYAYNAIAAGSRVSVSYDGGLTWPVNSETVPADGACNGGLHGNIIAAADGTLYIPKRHCEGFVLAKSTDSGLTWTQKTVGADAGGSECRKNADLATDRVGNVYGVWPGADNHLYFSTSVDAGETWLGKSLRMTPESVNMTTMPAVVAGDAGRIAAVYYGTADGARGPDEVDEAAIWHLYATYSMNALDANPTFVTVRVTDDPIQVGGVSTNSGCAAPAGSRNLLDFLDAQLDTEGRLYVAYTDGCVGKCIEEPTMENSRSGNGAFAVLETGPSLYADIGSITTPAKGVDA